MTAPADELARLRAREQELLDQIAQLTNENHELRLAANASRNFKASHAAGYIDLDLDRI
ncbi:hypothetical protein HZZ00_10910 [Streptomyces sp. NEAU-sy36]|uniref:hypothetical protein n=1 Tax=unclassified Streptomyces TaxID=2593676 RepID=UPI0015D62DAE|nr:MULTISPECIES: hypothetical protein [unclassified Streptomyces]QLJ01480.1 hypothetical protein HZZ00_10910 [Streptomyces sp. NEAU-sy36]